MSAPQADEIRQTIDRLRDGGVPKREMVSLLQNGGSYQATIIPNAINSADVDVGEDIEEWWLPSEQLIVFDLSATTDE